MIVYGHPMSTCTRKVLMTLHEKGAPFDFVTVDIMKGEAKKEPHLSRQPFGQVPAIDDDGFALYESRAIMRYLDQKLGGTKLTPQNLQEAAKMEQFISIETSNFTPPAMKIIYQLVFGSMMGKEPDAGAVDEGKKGVTRVMDVLDKALAGRDFLAGQQFSLAEIAFAPYIDYLYAGGVGDELVGSRTHVGPWWRRVAERASFRKATGKA